MTVKYMKLEDIQPSQSYICEAKLERINAWIDVEKHNYDPIPVRKFGERYVFTDGHTRALAISQKGKSEVKVRYDEDVLDLELYEKCIDLCVSNKILDICSLNDRVVDSESYEELWHKKCADLHEEIQKSKIINR